MGVCGSCGTMVNGEPKLTCATFLRDYFPEQCEFEPLNHFPVVRDLSLRWTISWPNSRPLSLDRARRGKAGRGRRVPANPGGAGGIQTVQHVHQLHVVLFGLSCVRVGGRIHWTGALALAHRYNMDTRDKDRTNAPMSGQQRRDLGVHFCRECSVVCPKDVDPAAAIQRTKVATTKSWFKSILMPWGAK